MCQKTVCVLLLPLQKPRKISDNETIIVSIDNNVNQMRKRGKTAFSRQKRQTGQTRQEATSSGYDLYQHIAIFAIFIQIFYQRSTSNCGHSGLFLACCPSGLLSTSWSSFQAALLISALQQQQTTEEEQAIVQDGIFPLLMILWWALPLWWWSITTWLLQ